MKVVMVIFNLLFLTTISIQAQIHAIQFQEKYALADSISNMVLQQWTSDSMNHTINHQLVRDSLDILHKIDSLQQLQLPTGKYERKLQTLSNRKDSLLSEVSWQKDEMALKLKGRLQEWQNNIKVKLGLDSLEYPAGMKIPGGNVPDIPDNLLSLHPPSIPSLQGTSLPALPALSAGDFQNMKLSPDLSLMNQSLPFDDLNGLKNIQEKFSSIRDDVSQVTSFTTDPDKAIDAAVTNINQLNALQEKIDAVEELQHNEFLQKAKLLEDPKVLKASAQQAVIKEAVNHFSGKEAQLKQAMEKLAEYKQKYASVNSLTEVPKRRPNEMSDRSFGERLLPGVSLQIQQKNDLLINFNPYLGYRLTKRLTAGGGWNQRLAFIQWNQTNHKGSMYGPSAYTEFRLWKAFSPRLEVGYINNPEPADFFTTSLDLGQRAWVFSSMIGLKKEYRLIKNVRGTALLMFNLFNPHHTSPYLDVLNMRFGVEFPIKKEKVNKL